MKITGVVSIIEVHKEVQRNTLSKINFKKGEKNMFSSDMISAELRMQEFKTVAYNNSILADKKSNAKVKRPFLNKLISALSL